MWQIIEELFGLVFIFFFVSWLYYLISRILLFLLSFFPFFFQPLLVFLSPAVVLWSSERLWNFFFDQSQFSVLVLVIPNLIALFICLWHSCAIIDVILHAVPTKCGSAIWFNAHMAYLTIEIQLFAHCLNIAYFVRSYWLMIRFIDQAVIFLTLIKNLTNILEQVFVALVRQYPIICKALAIHIGTIIWQNLATVHLFLVPLLAW